MPFPPKVGQGAVQGDVFLLGLVAVRRCGFRDSAPRCEHAAERVFRSCGECGAWHRLSGECGGVVALQQFHAGGKPSDCEAVLGRESGVHAPADIPQLPFYLSAGVASGLSHIVGDGADIAPLAAHGAGACGGVLPFDTGFDVDRQPCDSAHPGGSGHGAYTQLSGAGELPAFAKPSAFVCGAEADGGARGEFLRGYLGVGTDGERPPANVPTAGVVVVAHVRVFGAAQGGSSEFDGIGVVCDTGCDGGKLRSFGRQSCGGRPADGRGSVVYRHYEE